LFLNFFQVENPSPFPLSFAGMRLKDMEIFQGLSEEELQELQAYLQPLEVKKKEVLFSEGDPPEWLYLVLRGRVKITKLSQEGKEVILEVVRPGEPFGAVAVLKGFPYPANAVAMEDAQLLRLARADLLRLLDRFPSLLQSVLGHLGERLRDSHEMLKSIALEKVHARVAALLLKLAEKTSTKTPQGLRIDLKLTKQDIAEMVGTTVETSIRTMSALKRQGLVAEQQGYIVIRDPEGLRRLAP